MSKWECTICAGWCGPECRAGNDVHEPIDWGRTAPIPSFPRTRDKEDRRSGGVV